MSQLQLSFKNTIGLTGLSLEDAEKQCSEQERRVLKIMCRLPAQTPFQVSNLYDLQYKPIPITSIRRAITNLEQKGFLIKTDWMQIEKYGKPNHKWLVSYSGCLFVELLKTQKNN